MGEKGGLPGHSGEELGAEGEGEALAGLPCRTKQESSFRQEQSLAIGKTVF